MVGNSYCTQENMVTSICRRNQGTNYYIWICLIHYPNFDNSEYECACKLHYITSRSKKDTSYVNNNGGRKPDRKKIQGAMKKKW